MRGEEEQMCIVCLFNGKTRAVELGELGRHILKGLITLLYVFPLVLIRLLLLAGAKFSVGQKHGYVVIFVTIELLE